MTQFTTLPATDLKPAWQACVKMAVSRAIAEAINEIAPRDLMIVHAVNGLPLPDDSVELMRRTMEGWRVTLEFLEDGFRLRTDLPEEDTEPAAQS